MGHRLLGELPRTRNWQNVIALLGLTSDPVKIADATSKAAQRGLDMAARDNGVAETAYMLMSVIWAARRDSFRRDVARLGLTLGKDASLLDTVGAFDAALDGRLRQLGHRTDLAEMARFAAVEALTEVAASQTGNLFGVSFEDTQDSLRQYATPDHFGEVGQRFFGHFLYRFLDYHLSRELPNHVGSDQRWESVEGLRHFKDALALHCQQSARIVKEFAGCWPSATEFRGGITAENVRTKFIPVALRKVRSELRQREGTHA